MPDRLIASIAIYEDEVKPGEYFAKVNTDGVTETTIAMPPEMASQLPMAIAMMRKQAETLGRN